MQIAEAFVKIRPDTKDFGRETEQSLRGAASNLRNALQFGATVAGFKQLTDAASTLEQAVGGTSAVFGENEEMVARWAKSADTAAGLSERAARELTSQIGGLLQGFGFAQDEAAKTSISLAQLGADLAATFGGTTEEAVSALGAALRGETDPLERFGIALNQTLVNAKAVELGLAASTTSVDQHAKAQATLALITERSAQAQGQFAREADTAAGQAAISAAKAENAAADLGENLLPIYTKLAEVVGLVADAFGLLPEPVQTAVLVLGGIVALAGPAKAAFDVMRSGAGFARDAFDRAAVGAYDLAGGLSNMDRKGTRAVRVMGGLSSALGTIAALAAGGALLDALTPDIDTADLSKLENALLTLGETGKVTGELSDVAGDDLHKLAEALERVGDPAVATQLSHTLDELTGLGGLIGEGTGDLSEARQQIDDLDKALASLAGRSPEAAAATFDAITSALEDQGVPASRVVDLFDDYDSTLADVDTSQRVATDSSADLAGGLGETADEADNAERRLEDLRDAIDRAFGSLDKEEALDSFQRQLNELGQGFEDADQRVRDAQARLDALRAEGAGGSNADAQQRHAQDIADAEADLADAIAEASRETEGNTTAALDNREALRELAEAAADHLLTMKEQGASEGELADFRRKAIDDIEELGEKYGIEQSAIERYTDAIDDATVALDKLLDRYEKMLELDPFSSEVLQTEKFVARAQRGNATGSVMPDGRNRVGEYGPEEIDKHGSDVRVISAEGTRLSGSGTGQHITLNIYNPEPETPSQSIAKSASAIKEAVGAP